MREGSSQTAGSGTALTIGWSTAGLIVATLFALYLRIRAAGTIAHNMANVDARAAAIGAGQTWILACALGTIAMVTATIVGSYLVSSRVSLRAGFVVGLGGMLAWAAIVILSSTGMSAVATRVLDQQAAFALGMRFHAATPGGVNWTVVWLALTPHLNAWILPTALVFFALPSWIAASAAEKIRGSRAWA